MKSTKVIVQTAIFVALMVAGAWTPPVFAIMGVPFTLQVLFALMAGIVIGKKYGALSQIIYLMLGLTGLPIFANFKGGMAVVLGPTFGFLLGFILGAFLSGHLYQKLKIENDFLRALVSCIAGAAVIYIPGIAYMSLMVGKGVLLLAGSMTPFMLVDIAKAFIAAFLSVAIRKQLIKRQLLDSK